MPNQSLVGGDILRVVTAGMYDNPLVLYREYLQNAADSIASLGRDSGRVTVKVDPIESRVVIMDDGGGLSPADVGRRLIPIGGSTKSPGVDRGLRGIGRLSGLAFAESVHFTTRTCASEPVTRVSWDGRALRRPELQEIDAAAAIDACTKVQSLPNDDWPSRFFQVAVDGVTRQAASAVLNREAVGNYISEICPVPMDPTFPLEGDVRNCLAAHVDGFVLDVFVDGTDSAITRPFGKAVPLTDSYSAPFERLEERIVPPIDGDDPAAVVWLAHTPYAGSIPRRLGVRGLRARVGNIQVGSDDVFEHLFLEGRFNGWCIGEVHIVDSRIVPNARRDYFEPSPHLRNLENHIGAIAQEISARCRAASSHRNRLRNLDATIDRVKSAHVLGTSGYLLAKDAATLLARAGETVCQVQQILEELKVSPSLQLVDEDFSLTEDQFKSKYPHKHSSLGDVSEDTLAALQTAFGAVVDAMPADSALEVIESIVRRVSGQQASNTQSS